MSIKEYNLNNQPYMRNVILILVISTLYGCPTYDPSSGVLSIHNYSDSAIYICHTCSDSLPLTPELKLFEKLNANIVNEKGQKVDSIYSPNYRVNAYSYGYINVWGTKKEPHLVCKNKMIRLFIIKESTMRTNKWEDIYKNHLYVKKIILTEEQLSVNGWKYTYHP